MSEKILRFEGGGGKNTSACQSGSSKLHSANRGKCDVDTTCGALHRDSRVGISSHPLSTDFIKCIFERLRI
jgi:hypothetical protein